MSRSVNGEGVPSSTVKPARVQRLLLRTALVALALGAVVISGSALLSGNPSEFARRVLKQMRLAPPPPIANETRPNKPETVASLGRVPGQAGRLATQGVPSPSITATKVDTLLNDVDSDGKADPGDTLKYTVVISDSGADATGVAFNDNPAPNTTLVPGS